MAGKTDIWVYADWFGMVEPKCIGILSAQQEKGRKSFSFSYEPTWIHLIQKTMHLIMILRKVLVSILD